MSRLSMACWLRALVGTHALLLQAAPSRCQVHMTYQDSPEFLNNPQRYILDHPEQFSAELQLMATYQATLTSDDYSIWRDLPAALEHCAGMSSGLQQKSMRADELAKIILAADPATLMNLAQDVTFEEKRHFFNALASLPVNDRGMAAIDGVVEQMVGAGELPLLGQFDGELEDVILKVGMANQALMALDQKYSTLFLAVRKVALQARAYTVTTQQL